MKKLFLTLLLLAPTSLWANSKLTQLSTDTTPSGTNVLYEVKDPSTASVSRQVYIQNLLDLPGNSTSYMLSSTSGTYVTYSSASVSYMAISSSPVGVVTAGSTTTWTGTNLFASSTSIKGTQTNDDACVGCYGEYISSDVAPYQNTAASGNYTKLAQIDISSGDWDVSGMAAVLRNSATFTGTSWELDIGQTSASGAGCVLGQNKAAWDSAFQNGFNFFTMTMQPFRVKVPAGTKQTWYLNLYMDTFTGTPRFACSFRARRVR